MPNATRQLVTRDELNRVLTAEIRSHEDLGDAKLTAGPLLAQPDATGCNWSANGILNPGRSGTVEYATPIAAAIVAAAQAKYNIRQ